MRCKITGITIYKGELDLSGPAPTIINLQYDLIQDKDGAHIIHGTAECSGPWSEDTIQRLRDLVESIRFDLIRSHFDTDGPPTEDKPRGLDALFAGTKKVKDPRSI